MKPPANRIAIKNECHDPGKAKFAAERSGQLLLETQNIIAHLSPPVKGKINAICVFFPSGFYGRVIPPAGAFQWPSGCFARERALDALGETSAWAKR